MIRPEQPFVLAPGPRWPEEMNAYWVDVPAVGHLGVIEEGCGYSTHGPHFGVERSYPCPFCWAVV